MTHPQPDSRPAGARIPVGAGLGAALAASGYLDRGYAASLIGVGSPYELPRCGGWILERAIPGTDRADLMGPYPLFVCRDWGELAQDLAAIDNRFVSASLVADPFGNFTEAELRNCFPDVCFPFKKHFVIELEHRPLAGVSSHHRRYAKKALKTLSVEVCDDPSLHLDRWVELYDNLVSRHGIEGISAFSRESFARQLRVPGLVMMRARLDGATVGIVLWYCHGPVGYYHLGAYSDDGYRVRASFAIFWSAIEYFSDRLRWLNLGAAAGTRTPEKDGLARFKKGWSTATRTAYFCGRILDRDRYRELVESRGIDGSSYFPAYRAGEFS